MPYVIVEEETGESVDGWTECDIRTRRADDAHDSLDNVHARVRQVVAVHERGVDKLGQTHHVLRLTWGRK